MATLQELEELLLELLVVEVLEQQLAMPWKTLFQEVKAKARARVSLEAKVGRVSLEARVKARARAREGRVEKFLAMLLLQKILIMAKSTQEMTSRSVAVTWLIPMSMILLRQGRSGASDLTPTDLT